MPEERIIEYCANCRQLNRYWPIHTEDYYCGLCGRRVRALEVAIGNPDDLVQEDGNKDIIWILPTFEKSSRTTVYLKNMGSLPIDINSIKVEGPAECDFGEAVELIPEESIEVSLTTHPAFLDKGDKIDLSISCNFGTRKIRIMIKSAMKAMRAEPIFKDIWSKLKNEGDENFTEEMEDNLTVDNGRLYWHCPQLTLLPASDQKAAFIVKAANPVASPSELPRSVREDSLKVLSGFDWIQSVVFSPGNVGFIKIDMELFQNPDDSSDIEIEIEYEFDAVNRPCVSIPIVFKAGRPEWYLPEETKNKNNTLPAHCNSEIELVFKQIGRRSELLNHITEQYLKVSLDGRRIPVESRWPKKIKGGNIGSEMVYTIRIPPMDECHFQLQLDLQVSVKNSQGEICTTFLCDTIELAVDVVRKDKSSVCPQQDMVIDFGTTNSCVAMVDFLHSPKWNQCLKLPSLTGGDKNNSDIVPTLIWLGAMSNDHEPVCYIGEPAVQASIDSENKGRFFKLFKPEIGSEKEYKVPKQREGEYRRFSASDLAGFFIRKLVLHIRSQIGQRLIRNCFVTYPTAFSVEQRHKLEAVLEPLKEYGVNGKIELIVDEANAGAYRELRKDLLENPEMSLDAMIIDCGGGTIDVSILTAGKNGSVSHPDQTVRELKVRPCGVTGLRDFGGGKITEIVAELIGEKLADYMLNETDMEVGGAGWIPLPERVMPPTEGKSERIQEVAEHNWQVILEIAEQVKTRDYGNFGDFYRNGEIDLSDSQDWYSQLPTQVMKSFYLEKLNKMMLQFTDAECHVEGEADRNEVYEYLGNIKLTRQEIDEKVRDAILEVMGRSKRLWHYEVLKEVTYRPPDRLIFAGSSSQIPIIWKIAMLPFDEGGLGIDPSRISFSPEAAKRKVAWGAALYGYYKDRPGQFTVKPEDPKGYVMVPIVYSEADGSYKTLFPLGIPLDNHTEVCDYPFTGDTMNLVLYENMDYNDRDPVHNHLNNTLFENKEVLASFEVDFSLDGSRQVEHILERREDGSRWIKIKYIGREGNIKQQEKKI